LLGDVSDFPMMNLLLRFSFSRLLFPYQYGNRGVAITYYPSQFIQQIQTSLTNLPPKPLFLAIHLCLAHWPFYFGKDGANENDYADLNYRSSVKAVDSQFNEVLNELQKAGILSSSIIVLISDHGVALGLPNDRSIALEKYRGDKKEIKKIERFKLSHASKDSVDLVHDYVINTSFGQGNDVLSLKQYHVVLAFKDSHHHIKSMQDNALITLMDVAPTVLNYLQLPAMARVDGYPYRLDQLNAISRNVFIETGDKISAIETPTILKDEVVKESIHQYDFDPVTGSITLTKNAVHSIIKNKQHAIIGQTWMLAWYPTSYHSYFKPKNHSSHEMIMDVKTMPPYYVLLNLKTGQWTMDLSSSFAKDMPFQMKKELDKFCAEEGLYS